MREIFPALILWASEAWEEASKGGRRAAASYWWIKTWIEKVKGKDGLYR
jgi:hypothetical protein